MGVCLCVSRGRQCLQTFRAPPVPCPSRPVPCTWPLWPPQRGAAWPLWTPQRGAPRGLCGRHREGGTCPRRGTPQRGGDAPAGEAQRHPHDEPRHVTPISRTPAARAAPLQAPQRRVLRVSIAACRMSRAACRQPQGAARQSPSQCKTKTCGEALSGSNRAAAIAAPSRKTPQLCMQPSTGAHETQTKFGRPGIRAGIAFVLQRVRPGRRQP